MNHEITSMINKQERITKEAKEKFDKALTRSDRNYARECCQEWIYEASRLNTISDMYLK